MKINDVSSLCKQSTLTSKVTQNQFLINKSKGSSFFGELKINWDRRVVLDS